MLVLNINKTFWIRGGADRYYFALTKLLEENGHDVIPFSMKDERNIPSQYEEYFVSNIDVSKPGLNMLHKAARPIWSREAAQQLEKLLTKYKPDIAHIHLLYHQMSPSILPVLKKHNIPVVMTLEDYKLICPNYKLFTEGSPCKRCKKYKYYNAIAHKCLKDSYTVSAYAAVEMTIHKLMQVYEKNVDTFIAISQFVRDVHVEFGQDPSKMVVIPHFIDPDFLRMIDTVQAKPSDKPYMLFFGRLAEEKGLDKLLEMVYIYKPGLHLKIAGRGPMEAYLKAYIKQKGLEDRVTFLGHLEAKPLIEEIKGAGLTLYPSRFYEPFGLSPLESMAMGTPVVAFASGGIPEFVTSDVGRTVPMDDLSAFAEAIKEVQTWDKAEVAKRARVHLATKYTPEKHYTMIRSVYDHAIELKQKKNK